MWIWKKLSGTVFRRAADKWKHRWPKTVPDTFFLPLDFGIPDVAQGRSGRAQALRYVGSPGITGRLAPFRYRPKTKLPQSTRTLFQDFCPRTTYPAASHASEPS
jgi:hypothetical protein